MGITFVSVTAEFHDVKSRLLRDRPGVPLVVEKQMNKVDRHTTAPIRHLGAVSAITRW